MNQDIVTVVTVTYNAEYLLEETILSVINQSYENIEYIIIDGASIDKTVDIIKKYEDKIDYWVSEPDDGIYYAMNKAIEKATGKWINFMNAGDMFFDLDTVKYTMEHKDNTAELIYGDYQMKETGLINKARDITQWYNGMPFCHQTLFARRIIMQEELFDTGYRLAADHNFIISMYKKEKKFFYIDKTLAIFSLGGFAESNELLMNIESIKILLDHNVPQEVIEASDWYKVLSSKIKEKDQQKIHKLQNRLEIQSMQLENLRLGIKEIMKYSILKNPIQKYKNYKALLATYINKKDLK